MIVYNFSFSKIELFYNLSKNLHLVYLPQGDKNEQVAVRPETSSQTPDVVFILPLCQAANEAVFMT